MIRGRLRFTLGAWEYLTPEVDLLPGIGLAFLVGIVLLVGATSFQ